jgi:hypothetical protein
MRFACCILKATNTVRIRNTCRFSTSTVVMRTRPIVTLYIHCLSRSVCLCSVTYLISHHVDVWDEMWPARDEVKRAWSYIAALAASLCGACLYVRATVCFFYTWKMRDWSLQVHRDVINCKVQLTAERETSSSEGHHLSCVLSAVLEDFEEIRGCW